MYGRTAQTFASIEKRTAIVQIFIDAASNLAAVSKLWNATLNCTLSRESLIEFLRSPNLSSLESSLMVHNLLLHEIRTNIFTLHQLREFQGQKD